MVPGRKTPVHALEQFARSIKLSFYYRPAIGRRRLPMGEFRCRTVGADVKLTHRGCGDFLGLNYAAIPRLCRYSMGLSEPSETLIRFALYQRMYESTVSMN